MKKRKVKPVETILDSEKFKVSEEDLHPKKDVTSGRMVIDYTIKPGAYNGRWALFTALVGLLFMAFCLQQFYSAGGKADMLASSLGLCSILWGIVSVVFAVKGLLEKERNHTVCYIAGAIGALELITWTIMIVLSR